MGFNVALRVIVSRYTRLGKYGKFHGDPNTSAIVYPLKILILVHKMYTAKGACKKR